MERLKKRIRLLGTRQRERAVDDEERHAVHPKPPGQRGSLLDGFQAVVAVQQGLGLVPDEASPGNHVEERLSVADVPAPGEVRRAKTTEPPARATCLLKRTGRPENPQVPP